MTDWLIVIDVSPYFPSSENQPKVGDKTQRFVVNADDLYDAVKHAGSIRMGIESNPAVWRTSIKAILRKGDCIDAS